VTGLVADDENGVFGVEIPLPYRPPLDWPALLGHFRTHLVHGVEAVTGAAYERVFRCGTAAGFVRVTHDVSRPWLSARVVAGDPAQAVGVAQNLRRMFDLDCDPRLTAATLGTQPPLGSLLDSYPGLRVVGGWDPFETAVSTVLGQLVSTTHALGLVRQLVERLGDRAAHPVTGEEAVLFPAAETLAGADLTFLGTTAARKRAVKELSRSVAVGAIDLGCADIAATRKRLLAIPGIGPWSVEYISLRALGDRDAFPGTDLILKRATDRHPDIDLDVARPCRGYAAVLLWRHYSASLKKRKSQ
jgi:AraC family transcriptional regulator of adaptative response / DNA-3-methyladenine glycosylase II